MYSARSNVAKVVTVAAIPLISVVDDNESVRESLQGLIRSAGFAVRVFASAEGFMDSDHVRDTACLILDVRLPRLSGPELQRKLTADGTEIPVIFITAHGDDGETRTQALRDGAVDYLLKPLNAEAVLHAVEVALQSK